MGFADSVGGGSVRGGKTWEALLAEATASVESPDLSALLDPSNAPEPCEISMGYGQVLRAGRIILQAGLSQEDPRR